MMGLIQIELGTQIFHLDSGCVLVKSRSKSECCGRENGGDIGANSDSSSSSSEVFL